MIQFHSQSQIIRISIYEKYIRVLEHPGINEDIKVKLKNKYLTLNPAAILREINKLGRELVKS